MGNKWEMSPSPLDLLGQTVNKTGCKAGINLNKCYFLFASYLTHILMRNEFSKAEKVALRLVLEF